MDVCESFRGKAVTLMGLGLLGRGVGIARFLAGCGVRLTITDLRSESELAPSLRKLGHIKNITYVLGKHRVSDFRNADMVIKAAGVPPYSPYVKEARKNGVPVEMDASLFVKTARGGLGRDGLTTVGVTGTKGKSTVTAIIYDSVRKAGKRVHVGGNIRGTATLPLLKKIRAGDVVVLELDSWQLQGFGDAHISPHIAVFTNFMPDHMNYYGGNMKKYFEDKANIYKWQKKGAVLVCGPSVSKKIKCKSNKIAAKESDVPRHWKLRLAGSHNRLYAAFALRVARVLGIPIETVRRSVENFRGVPGRLECVGTRQGVKFYNDTASTMPEATVAALQTFPKRKTILIAGGDDKELNYKKFAQETKNRVKTAVFLSGTATKKIKTLLGKKKGPVIYEVDSMKKAVALAYSLAQKGDVILLSPGATSFSIFANEFERGDVFVREVARL